MPVFRTEKEAKEYIKVNPDIYFGPKIQEGNKYGYTCPRCKHLLEQGTEKKHHFWCPKCNTKGDVFDFIGRQYQLVGFNEKIKKACEIYGIIIDPKSKEVFVRHNNIPQWKEKTNHNLLNVKKVSKEILYNWSLHFKRCSKALKEDYESQKTNYLHKRGISIDTQNHFNIGLDTSRKNFSKSIKVIIPASLSSYTTRDIENDNSKYRKVGPSELFNKEVLNGNKANPIFVVEGEIDAMSFYEIGYFAVGLGSLANSVKFLKEVEKRKDSLKNRLFLVCLDNDPDKPGAINSAKETGEDLVKELRRIGFKAINVCDKLLKVHKDPNAFLVASRGGFIKAVADLVEVYL
jgi:DNA primase